MGELRANSVVGGTLCTSTGGVTGVTVGHFAEEGTERGGLTEVVATAAVETVGGSGGAGGAVGVATGQGAGSGRYVELIPIHADHTQRL